MTVYVAHVAARYQAQIEQLEARMKTQLARPETARVGQAMLDGFAALMSDGDRLRLTIDSDQKQAGLDLALSALPRTRLEQLFRAQRPSDYALLDQLPGADATAIVMAGHLAAGPYHQAFVDALTQMLSGGGVPPGLAGYVEAFTKFSTGDTAGAWSFTPNGASMTYLYGVVDRAGAEMGLDQLLASYAGGPTFELFGIKQTSKTVPGALVHDGVSVRGYDQTYDPKSMPKASREAMAKFMGKNLTTRTELAVFDQIGLVASGPNAAARATSAIDSARGNGPRFAPSEEVSELLAASRARKDSAAIVMNLGLFSKHLTPGSNVTGTLATTLGFADGSAHLRLSVSAASLRGLMSKKSTANKPTANK
jgi:hypothetical protein